MKNFNQLNCYWSVNSSFINTGKKSFLRNFLPLKIFANFDLTTRMKPLGHLNK